MNRHFIFFLAFVLGLGAYGNSSDWSYGFVGGLSSFNQLQNISNGTTTNSENGVYAGFFGEIELAPSLFLSPGAHYVQKGARTDTSASTVNYIEASGQFRWYLTNSNSFRAYLGGGPAYGVLMNASTNTSAGLVSDDTKLLARNELSVQGGLGFEFPLSSQTGMQVGFTYSRGLSNNLNVESAGGLRGHWQGFYAFTGLRFKNTVEVSSARERAEEYLRFKNSGTSPSSESGEFSEANSF